VIRTLIDAGPIIALFDRSDQHHEKVLNFMKSYEGKLMSTWPVLTEVSYMLDFHKETQLDFFDWVVQGGIEIHNIEQWQLRSIRETLDTYSDLPADLADTSLLEVAETIGLITIITLDKDFAVYRLQNGHGLKNLLDGILN